MELISTMRVFKWILLVAILGLWGVGTVWAEKEKEEAVEEEAAEKEDEEDAAMMAPPPSYSPPHDSPVWPTEGVVSPPPAPPSETQVKVGTFSNTPCQG